MPFFPAARLKCNASRFIGNIKKFADIKKKKKSLAVFKARFMELFCAQLYFQLIKCRQKVMQIDFQCKWGNFFYNRMSENAEWLHRKVLQFARK